MIRAYQWDFKKKRVIFGETSWAHLYDLCISGECYSRVCPICVCMCGCTCTFDQIFIIGPSSSLDFDLVLSSCQPTTFLSFRSHFVCSWQLLEDASHNTAKCSPQAASLPCVPFGLILLCPLVNTFSFVTVAWQPSSVGYWVPVNGLLACAVSHACVHVCVAPFFKVGA